jgi:ATP-binding cassette, subfamily B, multidrug efflux pump
MESGAIVEQGAHDDLIAAQGAYFRLYNSQFEQAATDPDDVIGARADELDGSPDEPVDEKSTAGAPVR